jgi:hypothetical protein
VTGVVVIETSNKSNHQIDNPLLLFTQSGVRMRAH